MKSTNEPVIPQLIKYMEKLKYLYSCKSSIRGYSLSMSNMVIKEITLNP